jgi:hypothetical protein
MRADALSSYTFQPTFKRLKGIEVSRKNVLEAFFQAADCSGLAWSVSLGGTASELCDDLIGARRRDLQFALV